MTSCQKKTFAEPRLAIFTIPENPMECTHSQGLIIAERTVFLKIDDFTVSKGLFYLIALYYVYFINYPSSCTAHGLLLFIQEVLLGVCENNLKKSTKYAALYILRYNYYSTFKLNSGFTFLSL